MILSTLIIDFLYLGVRRLRPVPTSLSTIETTIFLKNYLCPKANKIKRENEQRPYALQMYRFMVH